MLSPRTGSSSTSSHHPVVVIQTRSLGRGTFDFNNDGIRHDNNDNATSSTAARTTSMVIVQLLETEQVPAVNKTTATTASDNSQVGKTRQRYEKDDNHNDHFSKEVTLLWQACPTATRAECQRFYKSAFQSKKGGKEGTALAMAQEQLTAYLQWRQQHPQRQQVNDRDLWVWAWSVAWDRYWECGEREEEIWNVATANTAKRSNQNQRPSIPQYVFAYSYNDNNNSICSRNNTTDDSTNRRVIQVLPAQIDVARHTPNHVHTLAVALYLDQQLDRNSVQQTADLWLDVRGAPGWPNPTPWQVMSLIKVMTERLVPLFPELLHYLIVFPLPGWAVLIYKIIYGAFPKVVRERTKPIAGPMAGDKSLLYQDMMRQVPSMSAELIEQMEETRNRQIRQAANKQK